MVTIQDFLRKCEAFGFDDKRIYEIIQSSIDAIYFTKIEKDKVLLEVKSKVGTVDEYIIETRKRKCYMKNRKGEWIEDYLYQYIKRFEYIRKGDR